MDIRLGSLDVVMKVVAKRLDVRDNFFPALLGEMAREQHYIVSQLISGAA